VSNSTNAYGRRFGEWYWDAGYVVVNSVARSERYVNASFRGYDLEHIQRKQMESWIV
jgi:hypothetical protein